MTIRKRALRLKWPVQNITPNVEHRRLLVLARKVVVEHIVRAIRPVVEPVTQCLGFWHGRHVRRQSWDLRIRA